MTHPTDALRLVPIEPTEAMIEAGCRALHAAQGTGDADAPLHSPPQNSWEEPDSVRWKQWRETITDDVWPALVAAAPASPLPGGGWRTDFENAPDCEEGILIVDATKISPAVGTARFVGGEWLGYDHGHGVECSWPSPTHWMPLPAAPTGDA